MAVTVKSPPRNERCITCSKCGCGLAYLPSDVRTWRHEDDAPSDAYRYITCPNCGSQVVIPEPRWDDL
jgi:hypothetical protein